MTDSIRYFMTEVRVADRERSVAWYRESLGLRVVLEDAAGGFALLEATRRRAGGAQGGSGRGAGRGAVRLVFEVADLDAMMATLAARGIGFEGPVASAEGTARSSWRTRTGRRSGCSRGWPRSERARSVADGTAPAGMVVAMKSGIARELGNVAYIVLGIFSAGFGLHGFLESSEFIDGGVTGVSMLLAQVFGITLSVLLVAINLPFIVLGYRQLGRAFAIRSVLAIAGLAVCLETVHYPDMTPDSLLTAVFGGFFIGGGIGLAIRGNAVLDGTDIAALLISKRSHLFRVGDVILGLNIVIFLVAARVLGTEKALYSILTYIAASKTLDFLLHGIEEYTAIVLMSGQNDVIRRRILRDLGRGVTVYKGQGGDDRRRSGYPLLRRDPARNWQGQADRPRRRPGRLPRHLPPGRCRRRRQEADGDALTAGPCRTVPRPNKRPTAPKMLGGATSHPRPSTTQGFTITMVAHVRPILRAALAAASLVASRPKPRMPNPGRGASARASEAARSDVIDDGGMFSTEAIRKAKETLGRIDRTFKVAVTVETVESLRGQEMEEVAIRRAEQLDHKGIFILLARQDRKAEALASPKALRDELTQARLHAIRDAFTAEFRKGDTDAGLLKGVQAA